MGYSCELWLGRRIRTNRGLDKNGYENRIPDADGKLPWVPIDERFTLTKERSELPSDLANPSVLSDWPVLLFPSRSCHCFLRADT